MPGSEPADDCLWLAEGDVHSAVLELPRFAVQEAASRQHPSYLAEVQMITARAPPAAVSALAS